MLFFIDQNYPKPTPSREGVFAAFRGLDQLFQYVLET